MCLNSKQIVDEQRKIYYSGICSGRQSEVIQPYTALWPGITLKLRYNLGRGSKGDAPLKEDMINSKHQFYSVL